MPCHLPSLPHEIRLVLLSFFDGVGSAAVCLDRMGVKPIPYISWETDSECQSVIQHHFPHVVQRFDACQDDADEVARLIASADPDASAQVLCAAGPPCPDFSQIRDNAPGRSGPEGRKFGQFCDFIDSLEAKIKPRQLHHLCENVIFSDQSEADHFSNRLQASPVAVEAADVGPVNRPRLFWTRIKWSIPRTNPLTGQPLRWGRLHRFPRLYVDAVTVKPTDVWVPPGFQLHDSVLSGDKKMPCLTTPSPDGDGRPPPRKVRGQVNGLQKQRWLRGGREYAPWQYQDHAMLHGPHGDVQIPHASTKENLHGFSGQHTAVPGVSDRSRHRMMANSWRLHIVQFILLVMLTNPTAACTRVGRPPSTSALQKALAAAALTSDHMGFPSWTTPPPVMAPAGDMWDHWDKSTHVVHPLFAPPEVEPGALGALSNILRLRGELPAFRQQVVQDLRDLVLQWEDHTNEWMNKVAPHVATVYRSSASGCVQVPVFLYLLDQCGYPGFADLKEDLTLGFQVIGRIHSGCGWLPRLDERYTHPISLEDLRDRNHKHICSRLTSAKPDKHWDVMLQELLEEKQKGRLTGPFELPSTWPGVAATIPDHPTTCCPDTDLLVAMSFAVEQPDKVRRIEDWTASRHNSTVMVNDVPILITQSVTTWTVYAGYILAVVVVEYGVMTSMLPIVNFPFVILPTPTFCCSYPVAALCGAAILSASAQHLVYGPSIDGQTPSK